MYILGNYATSWAHKLVLPDLYVECFRFFAKLVVSRTYGEVPFKQIPARLVNEITLDARKIIQGKVFEAQNYKLERPTWHQNHMHNLIQRCTAYNPSERPSLENILKFYMINVLSENGTLSEDAQCQCGRFLKTQQWKKFYLF